MKHNFIHDYPKNELPREKIVRNGVESLSDSELLAVILGVGSKKKDVLSLSRMILKKFPLCRLRKIDFHSLIKFDGLSKAKACKVLACFELSCRLQSDKKIKITTSKDIADLILFRASAWKQEKLVVFLINTRNYLIKYSVVTQGTLDSNLIHSREIFSDAIKENAAGIIIAHNHPSGECTPSDEDITVTKELINAGNIIGIPVLDHIIISEYKFLSMKEASLI